MGIKDFESALRKRCTHFKRKLTFSSHRQRSLSQQNLFNGKVIPSEIMGSLEFQSKFLQEIRNKSKSLEMKVKDDFETKNKINLKTKDRNRSFWKNSYFDYNSEENLPKDFFKNTSLHGLKYIGQRNQHILERLFWTISFLIALVLAYYMISDVWGKYRHNSVIITFAPFDTKIEEIPFPAITICNMNKILKSKAMQFERESNGSSRNENVRTARENLYYLNHVCSSSRSFTRAFNYSANRGKIDRMSLYKANKNEDNYDGGKEDLWQFFLEASPLCQDMILKCTWQEEIQSCSDLFMEIETDYGKCCTFNMVPPSVLHRYNSTSKPSTNQSWEWDGDRLLNKDATDDPTIAQDEFPEFPRRQKVPGKSFGLSILLNPDLDQYFCTTSDSVGFRLVPHLPIDVPHIGDLGSAIKPNSEVFINLRPQVTIADKDVIGGFSLKQRKCYFNNEHNLGYYNYYSSSNCIDECIANLTRKECSCRRHYQPGDDSKPLCGPKQFQCASTIKKKFVGNYKKQCKMCIPTCTEIAYHTETTYTNLQSSSILWSDGAGRLAPWANKNVSIVHIYFGEGSTYAKLRKELYGTVDLIANFGGLMGLSLGFSGLSLIEVIYFLTIRAWFKIRRRRKESESDKVDETDTDPDEQNDEEPGLHRSETATTDLMTNDIICYPAYNSPDMGLLRSHNRKAADAMKSLSLRKKKPAHMNHVLYTVAFGQDPVITGSKRVLQAESDTHI